MAELEAIKDAVEPSDLLYVADAMTGQDAIKSAGEFNRRIGVTGVVLTKMDGDARGGAALSVVVGRRRADCVCRQRRAAARISSRSTPIAWCRACSAWATCCRSSRRPKQAIDIEDAREARSRRSARTSSRSRTSAISCGRSRRWGRSSRSSGCCPGMGNLKAAGASSKPRREAARRASRRSSTR